MCFREDEKQMGWKSKRTARNSSSQSTDCVPGHTTSLKSKTVHGNVEKGTLRRQREKRGGVHLSLLTCGPQKPWFKGPTPHPTHTYTQITAPPPQPTGSLRPISEVVFVFFMWALAQQGGHFSGRFWTSLACSEWTHKPWEGEGERASLPPMHMHKHTSLHLYIQMCIQNMNTHPLWLRNTWNFGHTHTHAERRSDPRMMGTVSTAWPEVYICDHGTRKHRGFAIHTRTQHFIPFTVTYTHAHTNEPSLSSEARFSGPHWLSSKCLGASGIQLAFGAGIRYCNLTLTGTVTAPPSTWEDQTNVKKDRIPPFALLGLLLLLF